MAIFQEIFPDPTASNFGFQARGQYPGEGDGNGYLEGIRSDAAAQNSAIYQTAGEVLMFWRDLSDAGLVDGKFSTASSTVVIIGANYNSPGLFFPQGKIGRNNYVNVWSGGYTMNINVKGNQLNYFTVSLFPVCLLHLHGDLAALLV